MIVAEGNPNNASRPLVRGDGTVGARGACPHILFAVIKVRVIVAVGNPYKESRPSMRGDGAVGARGE